MHRTTAFICGVLCAYFPWAYQSPRKKAHGGRRFRTQAAAFQLAMCADQILADRQQQKSDQLLKQEGDSIEIDVPIKTFCGFKFGTTPSKSWNLIKERLNTPYTHKRGNQCSGTLTNPFRKFKEVKLSYTSVKGVPEHLESIELLTDSFDYNVVSEESVVKELENVYKVNASRTLSAAGENALCVEPNAKTVIYISANVTLKCCGAMAKAVKYLHVGADDAMWIMDSMEASGEAARHSTRCCRLRTRDIRGSI